MATDYYAVLGVRRDAGQDEIKKAFRRLARELHPDVNPDPKTQERFKEINAAYEVLSDPQKRQVYDLGGDPLSPGGGGGAGGFGAGAAGFGFGSVSLVDHPVTYRRQQPPVGSQVAEQQAVVRYHDIRAFGAAAGAVHETRRAEIGTLTAQAVMAGRGDGETRERAVVYLQAVHVVVLGLLDV